MLWKSKLRILVFSLDLKYSLVKIAIKKEILFERSEFISFQLFLLTNSVKTGFEVLIFASLYQDKDERVKSNHDFRVLQSLICINQ